jgi:hypothetical protein
MGKRYGYLLKTGVVLTPDEHKLVTEMVEIWGEYVRNPTRFGVSRCPMCSYRDTCYPGRFSGLPCVFVRLEGGPCTERGPISRIRAHGQLTKRRAIECVMYLKRMLELPAGKGK